jgi:hypothetical protein
MTTKCIICDTVFDVSNSSEEHVIPNSIGGRLVVNDFICRTCNSTKGDTWDLAIAQYFNPLCIHFKITRDRGTPPYTIIERQNGEKLRKYHDGSLSSDRPVYKEIPNNGKRQLHIQAPTEKLFMQMLSRAAKEFTGFNVEAALCQASREPEMINELVSFAIISPKGGLSHSLVKTILSFARFSQMDLSPFDSLLGYLRGGSNDNFYGTYYKKDIIRNRPSNVFHCVCLSSKNQNGMLLGYIEYFSSFRYLFKIADNLSGYTQEEHVYAVDPITGMPIKLAVDMQLTSNEVNDCLVDTSEVSQELSSALSKVFHLGMPRPFDGLTEQAVKYGFEKCGVKKGCFLDPNQYAMFSQLVSNKLVQLLAENGMFKHEPPI